MRQAIKERAIATYQQTCTADLVTLHWRHLHYRTPRRDQHLSQTSKRTEPWPIQSTKEIEENGKIPSLDCLVIRDNHKIRTTVYRKPTHTGRLLDQSSYNSTSHKAATIKTLTRRVQLVCDSPDSLSGETRYLGTRFLEKQLQPRLKLNTHRNTEPNEATNNPNDQRQGQKPTSRQTGSGVQNQMYRLPGHLYWGDW